MKKAGTITGVKGSGMGTKSGGSSYKSESKYTVKNSIADKNAKFSSEAKYSSASKTSASDKFAGSKSASQQGTKEEDKKYKGPSQDGNKTSSDKKYSSDKSATKDKWGSMHTEATSKYSSSSKYSAGNNTFSSQGSSASPWDKKYRDVDQERAFPYDRDHELRRSKNRCDADALHNPVESKYRKAGTAAVAVYGEPPRNEHQNLTHGVGAGAKRKGGQGAGCHNCTLL